MPLKATITVSVRRRYLSALSVAGRTSRLAETARSFTLGSISKML